MTMPTATTRQAYGVAGDRAGNDAFQVSSG